MTFKRGIIINLSGCLTVIFQHSLASLHEFRTFEPTVAAIIVYAALLSLLVSRDLLGSVTEIADDEGVHYNNLLLNNACDLDPIIPFGTLS